MKKITIEIYKLFLKHGSECIWSSDHRVSRPKGTTIETDEMFTVLEAVDHRLDMISTGKYNTKMVIEVEKKIEALKSKIAPDVFELMSKKYS
ncbi:MAG: hypothetical protein NT150_00625 [Bacteroidetes bacterium]|nr:hypothetical protein [Bacteroidota bacterium]